MPFSVIPEPSAGAATLLPSAERISAMVVRVAVVMALLLGGSNLVIWLLGAVPSIPFWPDLMVMRMNTAIGITTAALSLVCCDASAGTGCRRLAQVLGGIAGAIGALTAVEDLASINLGIDLLFAPATIPGDLANAIVRHPGRMSLNAALSLALLGLALVGIDWSIPMGKRRIWFAPGVVLLASLPVTLGLVGYLLGIVKFTGILSSTNVLLHTALSLLGLCVGVLAARPARPPVSRVFSTGADGLLLRWTLPGSTALFFVLGWLIALGRRAGMVGPGEGTALMLYGGIVLLFGLLAAAARAVGRQEIRARLAADALRRGQERSRAIIDTALDGVLLMDSGGAIVDWNPAAERIFGWRREEILGQPLADCVIPEELRDAHRRGLERYLATGHGPILGKRLELEALRRDGTRFPVELSINPLPGTAQALFVGFVRDNTERLAADEKLRSAKEAAEAASRAKDNFVAALSHELRTPLTPVLLSATVLREDLRLPADVRAEMAMMERNIGLEARLIDDLLDLTRITRGKLPLRLEPCDVHSLLSHAVDIVRDDARAKNIEVDLRLSAQLFGITGDPARLQQVFWNLLKNAVKFTPTGGRIVIKTHDATTGERLIVEVADTGLGFSPAVAEQIFRPFEQAGREADHRAGGLGLGLAIARAIVDLHGGAIHAESPGEGLGATFAVEFPGATLPVHGIVSDDPEPGEAAPATPRRILLVEDHEATLTVLTRLLKRAGHTVTPASSVAAALAAAAASNFEILISDLGLPDGTGVELIRALRIDYPDFRVIALSGYGMEEDLQRTQGAGFDDHLVKPVDFDQLRRALRKLTTHV